MSTHRTVEVFSAGCPLCEETLQLVHRISCPSCSVTVHNMKDPEGRERARTLGVRSVPSVVVNGQLAACCAVGGVDEPGLRAAGVGQILSH